MSVYDQEQYYFRPNGLTPYGSPAQGANGFSFPAGATDYNKAATSGIPQGFSQNPQALNKSYS